MFFFNRGMDGIPVVMGKFGNFGIWRWMRWILEVGIQPTRKKSSFHTFVFFVTRLRINEMCYANLTDLGGLWADMMLGCVLP